MENSEERNYLQILSEIRSERQLKELVHSGIVRSFVAGKKSLADIYSMTEDKALLLPGFGLKKLTYLKELQSDLKNHPEKYVLYYQCNIKGIEIPFEYNESDTLAVSLLKSIADLVTMFLNKGEKHSRIAYIIQKYFGINGEILNRDEIASELDLTEERVRQLIAGQNFQLLFSGEEVDLISINPQLVCKFQQVKRDSLYNDTFISCLTAEQDFDSRIIGRIAELLSSDLAETDRQIFLVQKDEVVMFREHHRALFQTMCKEELPFSVGEICEQTQKNIDRKFKFQKQFILSLLGCADFLEPVANSETSDNAGYQCKWQFLSSLDAKAKRIIYETAQSVDRKEILEEYNRRERLVGLDELTTDKQLVISADSNFDCQSNGVWQYWKGDLNFTASSLKNNTPKTLKSIIEEYIVEREGKVLFNELWDHFVQNKLKYKKTSVRAILTSLCLVSKVDKNVFVLENLAGQYPELELLPRRQKDVRNQFINKAVEYLRNCRNNESIFRQFKQEVLRLLQEEEDIKIKHQSNFGSTLFVFVEIGVLTDTNRNGERIIGLDMKELEKYDLTILGKQEEEDYKKKIRSLAINFLKEKENYECPLLELRTEFIQYVKEGIKENAFYKIFKDSRFFEKTGNHRNTIIRLNAAHLPESKSYKEEVPDPELSVEIEEQHVIEKLPESPKVEVIYHPVIFNWVELKKQLKKELADYGFTDEGLEAGINTFYRMIGGEQADRWGQSILKCFTDFWFKSNDYFDREAYLLKLAHYFESYLKSFDKTSTETDGLASVVQLFPEMQSLKAYKYEYKELDRRAVDYQKKAFSYIIHSLSFYGNKFRHDARDESLDMAVFKQTKIITDFAALYVYTGYLLENN